MPQISHGVIEGSCITVNTDNDDFGKRAIIVNPEVVNTAVPDITGESEVAQKPGMTGNSDIVSFTAKESTQETDIEALRTKV